MVSTSPVSPARPVRRIRLIPSGTDGGRKQPTRTPATRQRRLTSTASLGPGSGTDTTAPSPGATPHAAASRDAASRAWPGRPGSSGVDELTALLATCKGNTFYNRRDEAVIRLFLDTGMRAGELLGLELDDVDREQSMAFVTGKGGRGRACRYGVKTAEVLRH
nr:site-specific integrase [Jiangella mangrovi]